MRHPWSQPRWILAGLVVVALASVFVRLGFWQLDRHDLRVQENEIGSARIDQSPIALTGLLEAHSLEDVEFRPATVSGVFARDHEVLIRSQVALGQAGFHVITPLVLPDGSAVLVNRGWVPLTMDTPPVPPAPSGGEVTITGWVRLSQPRPPLGQEEPPGTIDTFNRVDIDRISSQLPFDVVPVYLVAGKSGGDGLPRAVRQPGFDDRGPHLAYAIQWFGFATVGLVGFVALYRKKSGVNSDLKDR